MDASDNTKFWLRGIRKSLTWDGKVEVERFDEEVEVYSEKAKENFIKRLVDADLAGLGEVEHSYEYCQKLAVIADKFKSSRRWITKPDELYVDFGNGWHTAFITRRQNAFNGICKKSEENQQ